MTSARRVWRCGETPRTSGCSSTTMVTECHGRRPTGSCGCSTGASRSTSRCPCLTSKSGWARPRSTSLTAPPRGYASRRFGSLQSSASGRCGGRRRKWLPPPLRGEGPAGHPEEGGGGVTAWSRRPRRLQRQQQHGRRRRQQRRPVHQAGRPVGGRGTRGSRPQGVTRNGKAIGPAAARGVGVVLWAAAAGRTPHLAQTGRTRTLPPPPEQHRCRWPAPQTSSSASCWPPAVPMSCCPPRLSCLRTCLRLA